MITHKVLIKMWTFTDYWVEFLALNLFTECFDILQIRSLGSCGHYWRQHESHPVPLVYKQILRIAWTAHGLWLRLKTELFLDKSHTESKSPRCWDLIGIADESDQVQMEVNTLEKCFQNFVRPSVRTSILANNIWSSVKRLFLQTISCTA